MRLKTFTLTVRVLLLLLALGAPRLLAFNHPCVPHTLQDLDTIKASLNQEPWKSGFAALAADGKSQLTYVPNGPHAQVGRTPDVNLWPWRNDMQAAYNLARMWYFTGDGAYAQKARDILISWADTHTAFTGQEISLSLGDYAHVYGGAVSILRGTWPGWTAADTTKIKNYFLNVYWPASYGGANAVGPANKGSLNMKAGIALAVCLDDTAKFDFVINNFRTHPASGLPNTLPIGVMGETGRDAGHGQGDLYGKAFIAEVAWSQGIDLFSELDNRLLAVGEYYARNTLVFDNPFVPFGTIDYNYYDNAEGPYTASRAMLYILQNAYKNRFGLPTPWIDQKLQEQPVDAENWMLAKPVDFTTATPLPPIVRPAVSVASSGLTLTTLGSQTAGRSASYADGVWTVTGLGNNVWTDAADDCQFVYGQMTGDCAIVAQVTSCTYSGSTGGKAGLMIRDNLTAAISQRAWIGIMPSPGNMLMESRATGWTETWGGSNWARRSQPLPPGTPYWLKIERRGQTINSYTSPDGTSWAAQISSFYGNLPSTVYIGLFVASGNTTPSTATFANVAFTGGMGGLTTTPAAPAALFATGSGKAVTVRWLPSFGATSYDLLRSTTSGSGYTLIASDLAADKTSYMDAAVSAGTTYYYVARAKNSAGTSGNSPQFYAALLTPMVNLAFSGTSTASFNQDSITEGSAKAFDSNPGSKWFGWNSPTGWLQYDFGAGNAQVVKRYTINSADVAERDPKDWSFLGSQDGASWTTLDSRSNQSFAVRMQQNAYPIGNTTAYRYYRLDITANNGATGVAVAELGLWSDSGRTLPDGTYVVANRNSNKVVALAGDATAGGTAAVQSSWTGGDTQHWTLTWQGNGQYRATNLASAKVLDNGGNTNAGADLIIQPWTGGSSQLWTIVPDSDGFYRIASVNSGLVVDVSGGSTAAGANIIQSTYSGGDSQLWMPGVSPGPQPIPPTPTGLAATAVSISQINLAWTASPGALHYRIKRATSSGGPYTSLPAEPNTTTWSDTGLTTGTTYYYVVSALNGSGESTDSAQAQATTLTAPPAAPTGVTLTSGPNRITLNWTAAGGATSYTVKRATSSGGPYTTVAEGLTGTTYTDTGVANDVTYYYVVSAANANGSSPESTEVAIAAGTLCVHLKFDESSGAIATDSSGRAQHATLVSAPGFAAGMLDNALELPASSAQHAKLPSGIVSGLTDFTVSTWVKVNTFANWQRIFDFGTGTNNYMFLTTQYPGSAAKLRFGIRTPSVAEQKIDSSIALTAGVWTHIAVIRTGTTVSLYINGTLAGSGTITLSPADLGFTTLNYLGKSQFNDPYLNAALDDFRLHAYAMSGDELADLANPAAGAPRQLAAAPGHTYANLTWTPNGTTTYTVKRSTTSGGPYATVAENVTALTYTDTGLTNDVTYYYVVSGASGGVPGPDSAEVSVTPSPLTLHLKFDQSSGAVAADSSSGARHATLVNGPGFVAGISGNAVNLAASSSQHAKLPSGILSGLTDFTLSTWIKVNTFANWQRIFDFGSGTNNFMFLAAQGPAGAGRPRFAIRTPSVAEQRFDSSIALTAGVWTHIALIRSGTTVSLYINGSLAGSGTITLNPADLGATTQNYLGKSQFNDPHLNAAFDDFRIYGHAMSAGEIAAFATPLAAPQNVVATPGPLSLDLTWSAVPTATHYTVKYATTSGGPYVTLGSELPATSQLHSGLNYGTTYYYVVSAGNSLYEGPTSAEITGTPAKAPASVALGTLTFTYDGTPKATTATTDPAGLAVDLTYDGSATAPTDAGSYAVTATVTDANYVGSATGTLTIAKATAGVTLGTLTFTYDGTPKAASATTAPAGLAVNLTYDGSATAPTNAGSYTVAATVNSANYTGSATGTLTIAKATATIALSPLAQVYDGTAKSVTATTSPAGLAVTLTYDGATAAPIYPTWPAIAQRGPPAALHIPAPPEYLPAQDTGSFREFPPRLRRQPTCRARPLRGCACPECTAAHHTGRD
jgi:fibronectin type 3 domain-containing protein